MKPKRTLRQLWLWLPPQTWPEVFAVIIGLDLAFLAAVFLLDALKRLLAT